MCYSYHNQLILQHGWTQTSLMELHDFTEINVALWIMISYFLKNLQGPTFANLGSLG
jgi:hypothetical protein